MSVPKCLFFFPGFGGPDLSFWPDVHRDVRPRTSSLGCFFVPELQNVEVSKARESAKIPFTLRMAKTKTMVLVFGFSFPFSAGFQGKIEGA